MDFQKVSVNLIGILNVDSDAADLLEHFCHRWESGIALYTCCLNGQSLCLHPVS